MTTQVGVEGIVPAFTQGDRLRKARTYAGLTVAELSERAGMSEKTVNNYEGDRVKTRRPTLIAWALATGVSLEWLETGAQPHHGPNPPAPARKPDPDGLAELAAQKRRRARGTTAEYVHAA